jgi:cobyrinic acid a,c-diamide synthase
MLPVEVNQRIFVSACRGADFAVVEGMMGLFDGVRGSSEQGSSAEIAKLFGLPVLLVVDASSSARSVAALVHGFRNFDPGTRVAGVVLNRVAGVAHAEILTDALRQSDPQLWVGWLPHEKELQLGERYLGLHTSEEGSWTADGLDLMATLLEQHCPIERLLEMCQITLPEGKEEQSAVHRPPVRIGVARDRAFCFYYQAGLDELRRQGAELVEFSPLTSAHLPAGLDALYFGGGYPELYAETLSNQRTLISDLRQFANAGKPVYGECGGLIFLGRDLITQDETKRSMAGLLPLSIQMTERLVHFGYAEVEFLEDGLARKGTVLRGHSFHCSKINAAGDVAKTAVVHYSLSKQSELEEFAVGNVFGSYVHLNFAADTSLAARFVSLALAAREKHKVQA